MCVESLILATVFEDDGFAIVTFATYKNHFAIGGGQHRIPFATKNLVRDVGAKFLVWDGIAVKSSLR